MATRKFKIIGLGGIGTYLVEPLARYLSYQNDDIEMTLIDGDKYEERNRERQQFDRCENKALVTTDRLKALFPKIHFRGKADYVTPDNIISLIREGDIVMLCVDNHATRKLVSERCEQLDNVVVISGGNDLTDGDVLKFRRVSGKTIGRTFTQQDRNIANAADKNPGVQATNRQGCEQAAIAEPQLLFANLAAASHMLNVLYTYEQQKDDFDRVCFDIISQRSRPKPEKILEIK